MNDIVFEILKVIVMLAVLVFMRYLIPLVKEYVDAEKLKTAKEWTDTAVKMAQQIHAGKSGPERKAIVVDFMKSILTKKNISISDVQLDALIEAAVKVMKKEDSRD